MSVQLRDLSWRNVARHLAVDCRIVIPLGATEQHGDLSLATDTLTAERACDLVCEELGILVSPALPFGASAFSIRFPGTISLRTRTICAVVEDMIDCFYRQGFRRIAFVTGHGGNEVITGVLSEAQLDRPRLSITYADLYRGLSPTISEVEGRLAMPFPGDHASWYEAHPFARVGPIERSDVAPNFGPDFPAFPLNPRVAPEHLSTGVLGGRTDAPPEEIERVWSACLDRLRAHLSDIPASEPSE